MVAESHGPRLAGTLTSTLVLLLALMILPSANLGLATSSVSSAPHEAGPSSAPAAFLTPATRLASYGGGAPAASAASSDGGAVLTHRTYPPPGAYPEYPFSPVYDPQTGMIYAGVDPLSTGAAGFDEILEANPSQLTLPSAVITTSYPVESMAYDPSNHLLYASEAATGGNVVVQPIDPSTGVVSTPIPLGTSGIPASTIYDGKTGTLFVSSGSYAYNSLRHYIGELDTVTATAETPLALPPTDVPTTMAIDPNDSRLFVTGVNFTASLPVCLVAFDLASDTNVSVQVDVGKTGWVPASLAYDPVDNSLYLGSTYYTSGSTSQQNVSVINATTLALVHNIQFPTVGSGFAGAAGSLTFDPDNQDLYLTSSPNAYASAITGDGPGNQTTFVLNGSASSATSPVAELTIPYADASVYVPAATPGAGGELWFGNSTSAGYAGGYAVVGLPPVMISSSVLPQQLEIGGSVTLSAQVILGAGSLTYSYSGLPNGCQSQNASSLACSPTVDGSFRVTETVHDQFGETASATYSFEVFADPVLTPTASTLQADVGQSVAFGGSVTGGLAPYSFRWYFGDGQNVSGEYADHSYAASGTYLSSLTVVDSLGGRAASSLSIVVDQGPANASIFANRTTAPVGQPFGFVARAQGGTSPLTYAWSFGDGSTGSGVSVSHAYDATGPYAVSVEVTDTNGLTAYESLSVVVFSAPALTPFTGLSLHANRTATVVGFPIAFSAVASGGTTPLHYAWDFGDGATATVPSPTHAYATAGTYTVTVIVTDAAGAQVSNQTTVSVSPSSGSSGAGSSSSASVNDLTFAALALALIAGLAIGVLVGIWRGRPHPPAEPARPPGSTSGDTGARATPETPPQGTGDKDGSPPSR